MADVLSTARITVGGTRAGFGATGRIDKKLAAVAEAADDLRDCWDEVGALYAKRQRDIFARGGRPRWKPLSPDYIAAKRRDGLAGKTLVRTGLLRNAMTSPRPIRTAPRYVVFGPYRKAPHWTLHKYGSRKMPKRDPLPPLTKAERVKVRDIIARHLAKTWTRAA